MQKLTCAKLQYTLFSEITENTKQMKNIILILIIPHILLFAVPLTGWHLMTFYIAVMFSSLKLATLINAEKVEFQNALCYSTAWIGMDPEKFNQPNTKKANWQNGIYSVCIGLVLLVQVFLVENPQLKAGLLFTAMIFIFHFGLLDLNSQIWNYFGRNTQPIMNKPWEAVSLADFWGKRWNMAFRDAAHKLIFIPLKNKTNTHFAAGAVFTFSGIMHEAVISVPAGGGFGGPFLYFIIQFAGLVAQNKYRALKNRLTTWLFLILPLPLLFHGPFFNEVFIPLTQSIGG